MICKGCSGDQSITLTTAADNIVGTANNDTINGFVYTDSASTSTFQAVDTINGGAGSETLNVLVSKSDGTATGNVNLPNASVAAVETINIRAISPTAANTVTLSAANFVGATAINADRASSAVVITNLATGAAAGMIGNGTVTNGALSFGYDTAAAAATLNISGGTKGTAAVAITSNTTNVTINSTGAANSIGAVTLSGAAGVTTATINAATNLTVTSLSNDFTAATTDKLTVSGAATLVTLGTLPATLDIIDASGLTAGGVSLTIGNLASVITGGAGNDTITTAGVQTGAVNAGGGTGDRLILAATGHAVAASAAKFTNFEVLQAGAFTVDASLFAGITALEVAGAASAFTKMTAGQAAAVTAVATATGGTFTLADATGTSDVLTVGLTNALPANAATQIDFTTATIDGFETLNVAANSGITTAMTTALAGTYDAISFTSAANLKSIYITGAYDVGVSLANAVKVTTLDLSGNTGGGSAIALAANTGALIVTGTGAADLVTLATVGAGGTQTINTGLGNDTVSGTQAQVAAATINGGGGTSDTLAITDAGTVVLADNSFMNVSGFEKITLGATTGLTFSVGGYANALATGNAGVLDVTAASLATTAGVTIDATGLGASNSLKLSLTQVDAVANASAFAITLSQGADSITIASTGIGNTDTYTITGGAAALLATTAKTIDLSGIATSGVIAVTTGAGADVVKASATAGTYVLGSGADTFTGGAAIDTVTGGIGADTMTGNGGADIFAYTSLVTVKDQTGITLATADKITDFVSGTDQLKMGTAGAGVYAEAANVADFATAQAAADVAMNGTIVYYLTSTTPDGGLLFVDSNSDGTADAVIKLTGINDGNFAAGDIIA